MSVYAVILCGGGGTRMGAAENKTLLPIGGTPALIRSLTAFEGRVQGGVLVVRGGEDARFRAVLAAYHQSVYALTPGGADQAADEIEWRGARYRVASVRRWDAFGYCQAVAVRAGAERSENG